MKSSTLTIRLPANELREIEEIANRFKKTKSEVVREAIEELLEDWEAYLIATEREGEEAITGMELRERLGIT